MVLSTKKIYLYSLSGLYHLLHKVLFMSNTLWSLKNEIVLKNEQCLKLFLWVTAARKISLAMQS